MLIGWLVALQGLIATEPGAHAGILIWTTLTGLLFGRLSRALRSSDATEN